jgi:UDP-GlcNAc:undecaprenyl-phosphate GlcNAc-1-phosphate transferase
VDLILAWAAVALVSAATTRILIARPLVLDVPNARKAHQNPTPSAGGLGFVLATLVGIAGLSELRSEPLGPGPAILILLGTVAVLATVSLADDILDLSAKIRLAVQIGCAAVPVSLGLSLDRIGVPGFGILDLGWTGPALTMLWIIACINAVNFMDGSDGLVAASLAIASAALGVCGAIIGSAFVTVAGCLLSAGLLGFVLFNWPPARIFMGDVGSQSLGFLLAVTAIAAANAPDARMTFLIVPVLLFALLFDSGFTLLRRAIAGERVLTPHRGHLFQIAARLGWTSRDLALLHAGFALAQAGLAIGLLHLPYSLGLIVLAPALLGQLVWLGYVLRAMRRVGLVFGDLR